MIEGLLCGFLIIGIGAFILMLWILDYAGKHKDY